MTRPRAYYENGSIIIRIKQGQKYGIEFTRIQTSREAVDWIAHLSKKDWFTIEIFFDFMRAWDKAYLIHNGRRAPTKHLVSSEGELKETDDLQYKGELPR